jgi:Vps52 / Sac2 family
MLLGFQSHLGSINTEMVELQQRSAQMSQQLSNRQAVRATLSQFIDDMTVSEDLISYVSHSNFPPVRSSPKSIFSYH